MAVTTQTYTLNPTWTAVQLADAFRSAFIDSGLMTDWFDSFSNAGIENRVLRVINDPGKTFGTVYYWFMFTTGGAYITTVLGWNTSTKVPTGTQYLDWFNTATNVTTNHRFFYGTTNTVTASITRYTSSINPNCTWFVARQSGGSVTFLIPYGTYNATSFVDQNKMAFNGAIYCGFSGENNGAYAQFVNFACCLRRTYLSATALRAATSTSSYIGVNSLIPVAIYHAQGNVTNGNTSNFTLSSRIHLPTAHTNTTGVGTDHTPVFTSILPSFYLPPMPADFALTAFYGTSVIATQDTFVVAAGTEEYEIIALGNNGVVDAGKTLLLARTVG